MKNIVIFILVLLLLTPSSDFIGVAFISYLFFFMFQVFGILNIFLDDSAKIYKQDLIFVWPLIIMIVVIALSHAKGITLGYHVSVNDFSDYLKFGMPVMVFFITLSLLRSGSEKILLNALWLCLFFYCFFFIFYISFGAPLIYDFGFGRGPIEYYRYGGIDMNPNAYAAIGVSFFFLLLPNFWEKKTFLKFILLAIILISILFSQSRATLLILAFVLSIYFTLSKFNFNLKLILFLMVPLVVYIFISYFELYWLTTEGRFDLANDRSFGVRVDNSVREYTSYSSHVGFFGIGPGKSVIERLDTISYIMYLLRYGLLGCLFFILIHINISFQALRKIFMSNNHGKSVFYDYLVVSAIFPIYVLGANISNEKWIDIKFITIWMVMLALAVYKYETYGQSNNEMRVNNDCS